MADNASLRDANDQLPDNGGNTPCDTPPHHQERLWAHVLLHTLHPEFNLLPDLIGSRKGKHLGGIGLRTGTKLRVRVVTDGHWNAQHWEGGGMAPPAQLMVVVTSQDVNNKTGFRASLVLLTQHLITVSNNYTQFCLAHPLPQPLLEGSFFTVRPQSRCASPILASMMRSWPPGERSSPVRVPLGINLDLSATVRPESGGMANSEEEDDASLMNLIEQRVLDWTRQ